MTPLGFGPWASGISDAERCARLRELRALVAAFAGGSRQPLVRVLTRAERDPAALEEAARLFDTIPTRWRRNVLATLAALDRAGCLSEGGPRDAA